MVAKLMLCRQPACHKCGERLAVSSLPLITAPPLPSSCLQRNASDDKSLRMVKTIVHELCKIKVRGRD